MRQVKQQTYMTWLFYSSLWYLVPHRKQLISIYLTALLKLPAKLLQTRYVRGDHAALRSMQVVHFQLFTFPDVWDISALIFVEWVISALWNESSVFWLLLWLRFQCYVVSLCTMRYDFSNPLG